MGNGCISWKTYIANWQFPLNVFLLFLFHDNRVLSVQLVTQLPITITKLLYFSCIQKWPRDSVRADVLGTEPCRQPLGPALRGQGWAFLFVSPFFKLDFAYGSDEWSWIRRIREQGPGNSDTRGLPHLPLHCFCLGDCGREKQASILGQPLLFWISVRAAEPAIYLL